MVRGMNNLFKDYEKLLIKNDQLSEENRQLKYTENLLKMQNETLKKQNAKMEAERLQYKNEIQEKEYEIARLKALLNIDGTNHGIPTSQTPINKKKVIPNTREKVIYPKELKKDTRNINLKSLKMKK